MTFEPNILIEMRDMSQGDGDVFECRTAMIPILLDHGLVRNAEGAVFGRVITRP